MDNQVENVPECADSKTDPRLDAYWARQQAIRRAINADQFGEVEIPLAFSAVSDVRAP